MRNTSHVTVQIRLLDHVVQSEILNLGRRPWLVRKFSIRRINDNTLTRANSFPSDRMILNIKKGCVRPGVPVSLNIRSAIWTTLRRTRFCTGFTHALGLSPAFLPRSRNGHKRCHPNRSSEGYEKTQPASFHLRSPYLLGWAGL